MRPNRENGAGSPVPRRVLVRSSTKSFFSSSGPINVQPCRPGGSVLSFLASTHGLSFLPNGRFFFSSPSLPLLPQRNINHLHQTSPPDRLYLLALTCISTNPLDAHAPRFENALNPASSPLPSFLRFRLAAEPQRAFPVNTKTSFYFPIWSSDRFYVSERVRGGNGCASILVHWCVFKSSSRCESICLPGQSSDL